MKRLAVLPMVGLFVLVLGAQLQEALKTVSPTVGGWILEAVAVITLAGLALLSFTEERGRRIGPDLPAIRWAVLFVLTVLASYLLANEREGGFKETQRLLAVLLLFYLIVRLASTAERVRALLLAILLSTCASAGISVVSVATGRTIVRPADATDEVRQAGGSGDPLMSSHTMMAGAAIGAVLAIRSPRSRLLGLATVGLGCVGILLTYSRSTALICGVLVAWMLSRERHNRRLPLMIAPLVVAALILAAVAPETYAKRFSSLADPGKDWTLERRIGYHLVALDLIQSHPVLGVGPGSFAFEYLDPKYRGMPGRTLEPRDLHNMYLGVLVETGTVGFACFAALIVAALVGLHRTRRQSPDPDVRVAAEAVQFALAGFLVACAVVPAQDSKYTWILLGLAVALSRPEFRAERSPAGPDLLPSAGG